MALAQDFARMSIKFDKPNLLSNLVNYYEQLKLAYPNFYRIFKKNMVGFPKMVWKILETQTFSITFSNQYQGLVRPKSTVGFLKGSLIKLPLETFSGMSQTFPKDKFRRPSWSNHFFSRVFLRPILKIRPFGFCQKKSLRK